MEHELSAIYDITHGLGLAIVTPRWMRHVLSEETLDRFVEFGIEVWEIDYNLPKMEIALEAIRCLEDFFYKDLGLTSNLTDLGITDGKKATCYPGCETGMGNACMQENAAVVRDGMLITGTSAGCAVPFGLKLVEALKGTETAEHIARQIVIR